MPIRTFALVLTVMLALTVGASAQAPASSELVSSLAKELGSTPEQAQGAAGTLFGLAQSRMKPEEWSKVAASVPGMDGLLKAAPAAAVGTTGAGIPGAAALGGLSSAAGAFSKLGLKPDMVAKAVPVLTSFVTKSGGADVGNLLAAALK